MTGIYNTLDGVRGKLRALGVIEASECAGLTPIAIDRMHSLAFLADVLSPVWGLAPFDNVALKTNRSPYYASFQESVDRLVFEGVIEVSEFSYSYSDVTSSTTVAASYSLRHESPQLSGLLAFLQTDEVFKVQTTYLRSLAVAMSRLLDSEIVAAARFDASWEDADVPTQDLIELRSPLGLALEGGTETDRTVRLFDDFRNKNVRLNGAAQLRLYASYLAQRLRAA